MSCVASDPDINRGAPRPRIRGDARQVNGLLGVGKQPADFLACLAPFVLKPNDHTKLFSAFFGVISARCHPPCQPMTDPYWQLDRPAGRYVGFTGNWRAMRRSARSLGHCKADATLAVGLRTRKVPSADGRSSLRVRRPRRGISCTRLALVRRRPWDSTTRRRHRGPTSMAISGAFFCRHDADQPGIAPIGAS